MSNKNNQLPLIIAIVFAAAAISGSIVFFALQGQDEDELSDMIAQGIEDFVRDTQERQGQGQVPSGEVSPDDDPVLGDPDAPVTMIEFSDYQCPFCRSFYKETLPKIKESYIDKGLVKLVYRDLPLPSHSDALPAALAANCARDQGGDEMYFKYHDKIFDNQVGGGTNPIPDESLKRYAVELGLDTAQFDECFENQDYLDEVRKDYADQLKLGGLGTPSFFINGTFISGAREFEVFESVIESHLEDKN